MDPRSRRQVISALATLESVLRLFLHPSSDVDVGRSGLQTSLPPALGVCPLVLPAGFSGGRVGMSCTWLSEEQFGGTLGTEAAEQTPVGSGVPRVVAVWDGDPDVAHLPFHPVENGACTFI